MTMNLSTSQAQKQSQPPRQADTRKAADEIVRRREQVLRELEKH